MRRIALASSVMSSLQQVWKNRYLALPTKIRVYEILVLPILLYVCETWIVLAADKPRLEAFHMKCQRQMSRIWITVVAKEPSYYDAMTSELLIDERA